jgi:uncharacterized membrane protein
MSKDLSKTDVIFEINYNPNFVPFRGPKVNVKNMVIDGQEQHVMKDHLSKLTYTLDELSYQVWLRVNGKRTVREIQDELSGKWADVTPKLVSTALVNFADLNLLKSHVELEARKRINIMSAFRIEIPVIKESAAFISAVHKRIRRILITPLLWAAALYVVLGCIFFAGPFVSVYTNKSNFEILGSSVVGFFFYYFVPLAPVIALHEFSHGLALVHYKGSPGEVGTGLLYFGPFFYIDAADAWTLKRRQRIIVYMAGNLAALLVGTTIVLANTLWSFSQPVSHFLLMTAFFCFYMTLWSMVPTFDSDGYFALADLLNRPNLRHDSIDQIKHFVKTVLRRPQSKAAQKEQKALTTKKKVTLVLYAVLAAGFLFYLVYQTSVIMLYMSRDVAKFTSNLWSMITFAKQFSWTLFIVGFLTVFYFLMSVMGYGVIFVTTVRKARVRNLQLEAVHDRNFSSFHYLPDKASKSLVNNLMAKVQKTAKRFTRKFEAKRQGSICIAELKIGGGKWDLLQAKSHMNTIEHSFRTNYQKFLKRHERGLSATIGIYGPEKIKLTKLLMELAEQASTAGMTEARSLVDQLMQHERRTMLYLLNSVFGTVCSIELPPELMRKYEKDMLPTFFARDLAITDLYDEVEDFKKRDIYGFDTLSSLGFETRKSIRKGLAHPEEYQLSSMFEPIRGTLLFVGRTEEMEGHMGDFGPLFVCQVWYGYMDNILSETNLTLSSLDPPSLFQGRQLAEIKDGELTLIEKNLSTFLENESMVTRLLEKSKAEFHTATQNMEELRTRMQPTAAYRVGLINSILAINEENMKNLPHGFKRFRRLYTESCNKLRRIHDQVLKEREKRKAAFLRRRRKMLIAFPFAVALSLVFGLASALWRPSPSYIAFSTLALAVLVQFLYWTLYFTLNKSFKTVGRYSSPEFDRVHLFTLALTETVHKFVANIDVLNPSEAPTHDSEAASQNHNRRKLA